MMYDDDYRSLYMIEAENGVVKIGCAFEPIERAKVVSLHSPIRTRLIAVWKGGLQQECALMAMHWKVWRLRRKISRAVSEASRRQIFPVEPVQSDARFL